MPYRDLEQKRASDQAYRAKNADKIREAKRAWKIANRERINAQARAAYHANPASFRQREARYIERVKCDTGVHPGTARGRRRKEMNPDLYRAYMRDWARESYHRDDLQAARRRARFCLSQATGVSVRDLPKELIEAKAAQLRARREIRDAKNCATLDTHARPK